MNTELKGPRYRNKEVDFRLLRKMLNAQETTLEPMTQIQDDFKEMIDIFINHLSEKLKSENYKSLIAISKLLLN